MRVSQRLDYAVRALVLLASQPPGQFVAAAALADSLSLPRRFVEQQITTLSRAGVVECRRGAFGGCALAKPAHEISAHDIVLAIEGEAIDVPRQTGSASAELWRDVAAAAERALTDASLADLAERQREIDEAGEPIYYI
jgi:Rrf2 family protein